MRKDPPFYPTPYAAHRGWVSLWPAVQQFLKSHRIPVYLYARINVGAAWVESKGWLPNTVAGCPATLASISAHSSSARSSR